MPNRLLDKERYAYINSLMGVVGNTSDQPLGIRELLELLVQTRDAEGTRLLAPGWTYTTLSGAAGVTSVVRAAVPAGFVDIIHACHGAHSDPTSRVMAIDIERGGQFAFLADSQSAMASTSRLPVARTFYVPAGDQIAVRVDAIAGASIVQLGTAHIRVAVGDYIKLYG